METAEIFSFIDELLIKNCGRPLTAAERLVIAAASDGKKYDEVAEGSGYKAVTIQRTIAPALWNVLSQALNQPIRKNNLRHVVTTAIQVASQVQDDKPAVTGSDFNPFLVLGAPMPDVSRFYGRKREIQELQQMYRTHRCVMLIGVEGIGKRSLVAKMVRDRLLPFEQILWKPVYYRPTVEQLVEDLLQLLGSELSQPHSFQAAFSHLIGLLQKRRCLLILDSADALLVGDQAGYRQLEEGHFGLLRRIVEETQSCLLLTGEKEIPQLEDTFSLRGYPSVSYPISGLEEADARQIFVASGLVEDAHWDDTIASLGRHPLLLCQIANWVKTRLGGNLAALAQKTVQLGILQYWFDEMFGDPLYLSDSDRHVLIDLATLQSERSFRTVRVSELISRNRISVASIDRLIRCSLVEVSLDSLTQEQSLSLNPLLEKYLLTDPRGLVQRPMAIRSA